MQHQTMESYIEDKKNLYTSIHEFLEESDENGEISFQELINNVRSQQIENDGEEMHQFLEIIKSIGDHHHRGQHFNERMNQLLKHYKYQIKQTLSNSEIFHIFENNKKIVHFLLQEGIMTISEEIYNEMINKIENNGKRYCHFFIPELEKFVGEEKMKFVKDELLKEDPSIFTNYDQKRQEGENDSYICLLIRQDSVVEFISHINSHNISPLSKINPSIFETNQFLIDNKNTTLIEYSAFFGSIQIFRYLLMNKAELTPSLWFYAIHSKNAELIHLLESNEIPPPKNYEQCFIESIKCHHNDIADYIENNFIDQKKKDSQQNEEIISNCIKYHNYLHFQNDAIIDHSFFYLSFYHYDKLFKLLFNKKEKSIEKKMIECPDIRVAIKKNEVEVIYSFLLKMQKISEKLFTRTKIKQTVIPSSVTSIGKNAFNSCSSLTQITIPSSVTSIGKNAFRGCSSLTKITIPSSVTSIGDSAFRGCSSLTKITIPSSVTSIGNSAFRRCSSLTQITIPSSVTSIGDSVFKGCSSFTQITIPSSVTSIGDSAFRRCSSLTQITIPSSVTSFGNSIFNGMKKLDITGDIKQIPNQLFAGCSSLTQITIPSSVTSIGNSAFSGCSSLAQITIPSSVTSIGDCAFSGCSSLTQITIPSSVTSIGKNAFFECSSLDTFKIIPFTKKLIKYYDNQYLLYKSNPNSEIYDTLVWAKPTINKITIPSSVTSIGDSAFSGCSSLTKITIPSSVTSIGNSAFSGCSSLTQITIPSSVTSIGNCAFWDCSSLAQITIPSSVTSIGKNAFSGCSSLTQITIPSSVTSIGDCAFYGCSSLTKITIPSSVTSIGKNSFWDCSSLTKITIPSSVTSIGDCAFSGCSSLKQITFEIPSSVTSIGNSAFWDCSSFTQITIPSSVTSIGNSAFRGCSSLTKITIPSSVNSIGSSAFWRCSSLIQITIPSSVISIGDGAFSGCSSLKQITFEIPSSVTSIGNSAFSGCSSLTQITIPSSVTSIGDCAFDGCSSLPPDFIQLINNNNINRRSPWTENNDQNRSNTQSLSNINNNRNDNSDNKILKTRNINCKTSIIPQLTRNKSINQSVSQTNKSKQNNSNNNKQMTLPKIKNLSGLGHQNINNNSNESLWGKKWGQKQSELELQNTSEITNEIEIMKMFNHLNVPKVQNISYNDENNQSISYSKYYTNLKQSIQKISKVQCVYFIYQIAKGMKYIHSCNIVHVNLDASSIFISDEGIIKISDFKKAQKMTQENQNYQMDDVYSFGKLVYFILSGSEINKSIKEKDLKSFTLLAQQLIESCFDDDLENRTTFEIICDVLEQNKFNLISMSQQEFEEVLELIGHYKKQIAHFLNKEINRVFS